MILKLQRINEDAGAAYAVLGSSPGHERKMTFVQCSHGGHKAESFALTPLVSTPALGIDRGFEMQHDDNQYDMLHCNTSIFSTAFVSRRPSRPTL